MFNFILPTQKGLELFPPRLGVPPQVRVRGVDLRTEVGRAAFRKALPDAQLFYNQQAHNFSLSLIESQSGRRITERGDTMQVSFSHGQEYIDIGISPRTVAEAAVEGLPNLVLRGIAVRQSNPADSERPYILLERGDQAEEVALGQASPDASLYEVEEGVQGLSGAQDQVAWVGGWIATGDYYNRFSRFSWRGGFGGPGYVYRAGEVIVEVPSGIILRGAFRRGDNLLLVTTDGVYTTRDRVPPLFASMHGLSSLESISNRVPWGAFTQIYTDTIDGTVQISPGGTKVLYGNDPLVELSFSLDGDGEVVVSASSTPWYYTNDWPTDTDPFNELILEGFNNLVDGGGTVNWTASAEATETFDLGGASAIWDNPYPQAGQEETYQRVRATVFRTLEFTFELQGGSGTSTGQIADLYAYSTVHEDIPGMGPSVLVSEDLMDVRSVLSNTFSNTNGVFSGTLALDMTGEYRSFTKQLHAYTNGVVDIETNYTSVIPIDHSGSSSYTAEPEDEDVFYRLTFIDPVSEEEVDFIGGSNGGQISFGVPADELFGPPLPLHGDGSSVPEDPPPLSLVNTWKAMSNIDMEAEMAMEDTIEVRVNGQIVQSSVATDTFTYQINTPNMYSSIRDPQIFREHVGGQSSYGWRADMGYWVDLWGDVFDGYPLRFATAYGGAILPSFFDFSETASFPTVVEEVQENSYVRLRMRSPWGTRGSVSGAGFQPDRWINDGGLITVSHMPFIASLDHPGFSTDWLSGANTPLHTYLGVPPEDVEDVFII